MSFQEMLSDDYNFVEKMRPEFNDQDLLALNKEEERVYLQQNSNKISEYPPYRPWAKEEHIRFLEALQLFNPNDQSKIAEYVITRNIQDVKLHSFVYSYFSKKNPSSSLPSLSSSSSSTAAFLQNSSDSLNLLFGSSSGLGLLGGGLNLSSMGLNTSISGLNSSMSGGINGSNNNTNNNNGNNNNGNNGSNNNNRFGMGNSNMGMGMNIPGLSPMNAGLQNSGNSNNNSMSGLNMNSSGGLPMGGSGGVNMSNINNMGGVMGMNGGMGGNNIGLNSFQQAGAGANYFPTQLSSGKFSSMMGEWSEEEQLAFEEALKKFPIDSANPYLAFTKIASCIPGGRRAAHDVALRYEMLLLRLGIKLESDHKPALTHQGSVLSMPPLHGSQGITNPNATNTSPLSNPPTPLQGSQGITQTPSPNSASGAKSGNKVSPNIPAAPTGPTPKVVAGKNNNNAAINNAAGLPNVAAAANPPAPAAAAAPPATNSKSRKRSGTTSEGTAANRRSKSRRKDSAEELPPPPAPANTTAPPAPAPTTATSSTSSSSLSSSASISAPASSSATSSTSAPSSTTLSAPSAAQTASATIDQEYMKANKLLDENLELINMIAPMDSTPTGVARNMELMTKVRDTLVNILNWTSTIPSSSGNMHAMPPLPVKINETLISYLSKSYNNASNNTTTTPANASSSSSSSSNAPSARSSLLSPYSQFLNTPSGSSPLFSPSMLSASFNAPPPPPLFSPTSLLSPSSGFMSPGLLSLSPSTSQSFLGSPNLGGSNSKSLL